jgi:hypothetical protein
MWFFLELTTAVVDRDTMPCTAVCTALLDLVVLLNLVFPRVRPTIYLMPCTAVCTRSSSTTKFSIPTSSSYN